MTVKIGHRVAGEWQTFRHANTFIREQNSRPPRLRIGARDGHRHLIQFLARCLSSPYKLLYVLHTSRTGAVLGRYESAWLESDELVKFFDRFGTFLAEHARHDLWVQSAEPGGLIVWDRHQLVYAYGPLEQYLTVLEGGGLREGWPTHPVPHTHHYHAEWDDAERAILAAHEWTRTDLRPEDEQVAQTG